MKFSRDPSGTAALTRIAPTIPATIGPAAQRVPRRSGIPIESAMAPPGIRQTPQKDAARQILRAPAAPGYSTASQLIDNHRSLTRFEICLHRVGSRHLASEILRTLLLI